MDLASQCFWTAGAIFVLMIAVVIFMFGESIGESLQRVFEQRILGSWPVRFITYRSGHGAHAA